MPPLLTTLVQLGGLQLVLASSALVRNKVLAERLGADGFGMFAQLAAVASLAATIAAFGFGMALKRHAAGAAGHDAQQALLAFANRATLQTGGMLVTLAALWLMVAHQPLAPLGLEEPGVTARWTAAVLIAFVPLQALLMQRVGFLAGLKDVRGMARGRAVAVVAVTLVGIPVVWHYGLLAAGLQAVALAAAAVFALNARLRKLGFDPWRVRTNTHPERGLVRLGVASLAAGFAVAGADVILRTAIIGTLSVAAGGHYQAGMALTLQLREAVLGSVGLLSIVGFTGARGVGERQATFKRLMDAAVPAAAVAFGTLAAFGRPLLTLLYSDAFAPAAVLLPGLLAGEFLTVAAWALAGPVLAEHATRAWLTFELAASGTRLTAGLILLEIAGLAGVGWAYTAAAATHALLLAAYVAWRGWLRIPVTQAVSVLIGSAAVVAAAQLPLAQTHAWAAWAAWAVPLAFAFASSYQSGGLHRTWTSVRQKTFARGA